MIFTTYLAVEPVERHSSIRKTDHPHPRRGNVYQNSFVSSFPFLLLPFELSVLSLDPTELTVGVCRKSTT